MMNSSTMTGAGGAGNGVGSMGAGRVGAGEVDRVLGAFWGVPAGAVLQVREELFGADGGLVKKRKGGGVLPWVGVRRVAERLGFPVPGRESLEVIGSVVCDVADLGLPMEVREADAEKKEGGRESLEVIGLFPNPTWVRMRAPDGRAVEVRVRTNAMLRPGARLECEWSGGRWVCVHARYAPVA